MKVGINDLRVEKLNFNDSKDYFNLIKDNKDRLIRYFPATVKSADSLDSITKSIKFLIKKAEEKEVFCFCIRKNMKLVGLFFIKSINWEKKICECAYFVDRMLEGKGITSLVFPKILSLCFNEFKLEKIFLRIDPSNLSSIRVAEKQGFKRIKVLPGEFKIETGQFIDLIRFELRKNHGKYEF